jgi:hypothetical protein
MLVHLSPFAFWPFRFAQPQNPTFNSPVLLAITSSSFVSSPLFVDYLNTPFLFLPYAGGIVEIQQIYFFFSVFISLSILASPAITD